MNFTKDYNTFSDIPGFDASKGERIVNALQKLWKKIDYLEQNRISVKKSRSEVSRHSEEEADLTITDVQYKLLVLQLQYVRSILRKNHNHQNDSNFNQGINEGEGRSIASDNNLRINDTQKSLKSKSVSQGIQTVQDSVDDLISPQSFDVLKDTPKPLHDQVLGNQLSIAKHPSENLVPATQKTLPSSSKSHYHLKLDDVPFILGASSTASHSVVANVQNIIAMMKSHHKSLCGPKHSTTKSSVENPKPTRSVETAHLEGDSQDTTKMLNELSQDLHELALKQQRLYQYVHARTEQNQVSNVTKHFQEGKKIDNINNANVEKQGSKRVRSNSESEMKIQAEVKNLSKMKQSAKHNMQDNQNFYMRSQSSNLTIMGRRKLLRSLQNFKTHLSEDDISWN